MIKLYAQLRCQLRFSVPLSKNFILLLFGVLLNLKTNAKIKLPNVSEEIKNNCCRKQRRFYHLQFFVSTFG